MEDLKQVIRTILEEVKTLEEKIDETTRKAQEITQIVEPSATESLKEVIKFTEESSNKIISEIDKVEENCKIIDKEVSELLALNPTNSIKEKLGIIKEKNTENMNILIKVYELFSFQDLSSQQIKEVINILEETKKHLLGIAMASIEASGELSKEQKEVISGKVHELLTGDRIFQEDVDKLLEELGL
jgi:chemotaxis protein CheZ